MTTRSKKTPETAAEPADAPAQSIANKEYELERIERSMVERDARLQKLEQTLRLQSNELETERLRFEKERAEADRRMAAREKEIASREREYSNKWVDTQQSLPPGPSQRLNPCEAVPTTYSLLDTPPLLPPYGNSTIPTPKVSFREATESVPYFDGYNIPLARFTRACRRAREIIPPSAERNLTKLLINKLGRRAYYAVEDEPCDTVTQLIDLLTGAFGSSKTLDQYRGELSTVYLKPLEHIIDYISRVKDLRTNILDAERRTKGYLDPRFVEEIDGLTARSFCEGLPLDYRLQLKSDAYHSYADAFSSAKVIAKRLELDKQRYDPRCQEARHTEQRRMAPIGVPSTPRFNQQPYRHDSPDRDRRNLPVSPRNNHNNNFAPRNNYNNLNDFSPRNNYNNRSYAPRNNQNDTRDYSPRSNYFSRSNYDNTARNYSWRNNHDNFPPRDNHNNSNPRNDRINTSRPIESAPRDASSKICKYCKHPGHEIDECRKRQYNNSRRIESGNATSPSGPRDANRADNRNTRPINAIEAETNEQSQS